MKQSKCRFRRRPTANFQQSRLLRRLRLPFRLHEGAVDFKRVLNPSVGWAGNEGVLGRQASVLAASCVFRVLVSLALRHIMRKFRSGRPALLFPWGHGALAFSWLSLLSWPGVL